MNRKEYNINSGTISTKGCTNVMGEVQRRKDMLEIKPALESLPSLPRGSKVMPERVKKK